MLKYFRWIYDHYRRNLIILQESIFCSISYFYLMRFCRKKKHCKFRNLWQIKQCNLESVLNNTFEEYLGPSVFFFFIERKTQELFRVETFSQIYQKKEAHKSYSTQKFAEINFLKPILFGAGGKFPFVRFLLITFLRQHVNFECEIEVNIRNLK